jgi:hypothetical protein
VRVIYKEIPARKIFNANDPALLNDVAVEYRDDWWNSEYDELRDNLRSWFIELFDASTGHYTRLRESIAREGIQDPIIITAGKPLRREPWMLPSDCGDYICESIGGSRLMIAQEMDAIIPCIVNDQIGIRGKVLHSRLDVLGCFTSKTYVIEYGPPVKAIPRKFSHMPDTYSFGEQQKCRRHAKKIMIQRAKDWSAKNTKRCGR